MKIKIVAVSVTVVIILLAITCTGDKASNETVNETPKETVSVSWPGYQPIPAGFDYPANTTTLNAALSAVNDTTLRHHAWSLFAGMMQPAKNNVGWPVWYTWPNSVEALRIKDIFCQGDTGVHNLGAKEFHSLSLIQRNRLHVASKAILDTLHTPNYPMPQPVIDQFENLNVFTNASHTAIIPGKHFLFNGDIMIPTESLSEGAYNWINNNGFYNKHVMDSLYSAKKGSGLEAPSNYVVTKHMYWPVLKGQLNLVPVWYPGDYNPAYTGYAGYEMWKHFVAVDPGGLTQQIITPLAYLYNVYNFDNTKQIGPVMAKPGNYSRHSINEFYYHQITQADWDSFDASDKAILMASSYWAYNKPIGVGDYLVTIASHINTKELYSWTMQSAWWTDQPNVGPYSKNRPALPNAQGPWQHYNLVDAYGLPSAPGGSELPMASNPYIELVIHPMQTNCNNCHIRAGYPEIGVTGDSTQAGYQNKLCYDMLRKLYDSSSCFKNYMRTDFQWIIPDYTHPLLLCDEKGKKK